jgi:dihydrolipoamide dehydrogenase
MSRFDLIVIGAGPGGYVAAIRGAQLGLRVASIEKEKKLGGTCLRIGCIPSKELLESSELYAAARDSFRSRGVELDGARFDLAKIQGNKDKTVDTLARGIDGLYKKHGITRYHGAAHVPAPGRVIVSGDDDEVELLAQHIVLATGSVPAGLAGIEFDGELVVTSTEALAWREVPERMVVIGAGAIGLELGSVWNRLGSKVVVLEFLDRILTGFDREIADEAQKILAAQGLDFHLSTRVTAVQRDGKSAVVETAAGERYPADRVLVSVGRVPATKSLGLTELEVALDRNGRIEIDDRFRTNVAGLYAIGDLVRGPMLAHKAEEEGIACVERIVTGHGHVNYDAIPGIVYTQPEVAMVGRTEEELREAGVPYRQGSFPFVANARARILGHPEGRVKVLAHAETDRVLGVHIVGARAGDVIAEAVTAIEFGASSEDIARTCHAHPTLAEGLKEAALGVDGRSIHI